MKQWDVFISHASEDKDSVAIPISDALKRNGVRVWLDRFEIKLGDSIRQKIDEGLANSRFGVAVLSEIFFEKFWTTSELDALFSRDNILPIWHGIDHKAMRRRAPLLAGRAAAKTSEGIDSITERIIERLFHFPTTRHEGTGEGPVARQLAVMLADGSSPAQLRSFLVQHPMLVAQAFGAGRGEYLRESVRLGDCEVDIASGRYQPTTRRYDDWKLLLLGSPADPLFRDNGAQSDTLADCLDRLERLRRWTSDHLTDARLILPSVKSSFIGIIVTGRRPQPESPATSLLASLNDVASGVQIRTFDWLLDIALEQDAGERNHA